MSRVPTALENFRKIFPFLQINEEQGPQNHQPGSQWREGRMDRRDALICWSSILVPGRPTLHLLSPCASHQRGIYRVPLLQALSLGNVIICASGVGQNWPRINKQEGRRTVNKQHIRPQSTWAKLKHNVDREMDTGAPTIIKLLYISVQEASPTFTPKLGCLKELKEVKTNNPPNISNNMQNQGRVGSRLSFVRIINSTAW